MNDADIVLKGYHGPSSIDASIVVDSVGDENNLNIGREFQGESYVFGDPSSNVQHRQVHIFVRVFTPAWDETGYEIQRGMRTPAKRVL